MNSIRNYVNNSIENKDSKGLLLCREVFQHMHHNDVLSTLEEIKQFPNCHFMATNYLLQCPRETQIPIIPGGTNNRNLHHKPFDLPHTLAYDDNIDWSTWGHRSQKFISLWEMKNNKFNGVQSSVANNAKNAIKEWMGKKNNYDRDIKSYLQKLRSKKNKRNIKHRGTPHRKHGGGILTV